MILGRASPYALRGQEEDRRAAYVASLTASRIGTILSSEGVSTSRTIAARKTMREAMFPYATARAFPIPSTIQRRLIASAGSASAKRGSTGARPPSWRTRR